MWVFLLPAYNGIAAVVEGLRGSTDVWGFAADANCAIRISSPSAESDVESWYRVWEATVALNAVCVRKGRRGAAGGLGLFYPVLLPFSFPLHSLRTSVMHISC